MLVHCWQQQNVAFCLNGLHFFFCKCVSRQISLQLQQPDSVSHTPCARRSMFVWFRQSKEGRGEKGSNQRLCTFRELLSRVKESRSCVCDVVSLLHMELIFCSLAGEIRAALAGNGPVPLYPPQRGFEFCGYLLQRACCEPVKQLHYEPPVSAPLWTVLISFDGVIAICISIISEGTVIIFKLLKYNEPNYTRWVTQRQAIWLSTLDVTRHWEANQSKTTADQKGRLSWQELTQWNA